MTPADPSGSSTPRWLRPAVGLASLLVAAAVIAVAAATHHDTNTTGSHQPPASRSTPAPATRRSPAAGGFGLPSADVLGARLDTPSDPEGIALTQDPSGRPDAKLGAAWFTAAPAGMMWQQGWGGAALPFSSSDGPAVVRDGIASGFADTPQGAALAAYDALARATAAPDGVWQAVIDARFVGDTRAVIDRLAHQHLAGSDAAKYVVVPDGFRVLQQEWSTGFAVVQIAERAPDGEAFSTWPMVWVDGDWHVRIPADPGALWQPPQPLSTLTDFGAWR